MKDWGQIEDRLLDLPFPVLLGFFFCCAGGCLASLVAAFGIGSLMPGWLELCWWAALIWLAPVRLVRYVVREVSK